MLKIKGTFPTRKQIKQYLPADSQNLAYVIPNNINPMLPYRYSAEQVAALKVLTPIILNELQIGTQPTPSAPPAPGSVDNPVVAQLMEGRDGESKLEKRIDNGDAQIIVTNSIAKPLSLKEIEEKEKIIATLALFISAIVVVDAPVIPVSSSDSSCCDTVCRPSSTGNNDSFWCWYWYWTFNMNNANSNTTPLLASGGNSDCCAGVGSFFSNATSGTANAVSSTFGSCADTAQGCGDLALNCGEGIFSGLSSIIQMCGNIDLSGCGECCSGDCCNGCGECCAGGGGDSNPIAFLFGGLCTIGAAVGGSVGGTKKENGSDDTTDDAKNDDTRRFLRGNSNDPTHSSGATLTIQLTLILVCMPLLINLAFSILRAIDNIYHNRAPRHHWQNLLGTLIVGAAAGELADIGYGYYTVAAWSIVSAYWFDMIFNYALTDNRKFEMGFTLTCDQFLRNFPQNATKEDLLAIGDQLAACHDEYKSVTLSKDPRPYVRWPYGALRSAFYGRIQSAELDKLQNPSKETALTRFAR